MRATVADVFIDAKGNPVAGTVVFTPDSAVFAAAGIVPPAAVTAVLDGTGAFSVDLEPTDGGNPSGWTYEVWERVPGGRKYHALIPAGVHKLSELAPVPESAGNPVVKGDKGDPNTLTVGVVTTGAAGSPAAATVSGAAPNQTLDLTIPKGDTGVPGMVRVNHGTDPNAARPVSALVYWVGTARPVNALSSDLWLNS